MDVDLEREEIDRTFEQLSQSQGTASQIRTQAAPLPPPQGNVGTRRNRRDAATKNGKHIESEPGFGNMPVNIQKNKRVLLEGLRHILAAKKMPAKKDAFNVSPLDKIDEVTDYLELSETGELLKYSSMVYGLRVDTTYNDAMSTNCQLQPTRMKSQDLGKKTKAEQKLQQSTATQSLNLQKLQCEMEQDQPDDAQTESGGTPDKELDLPEAEDGEKEGAEDGEGGAGTDHEEDGEEREKVVELTVEQKEKLKDSKPIDTSKIKYTNTVIKDLISAEYDRRSRNLDRKCDLNPMLMDDERKFRMAPSALLTNEYYQIATARYKDLNASGMLAYNAKVTHNGRMTLMHKRMDTWRDADVHDYTPPPAEFRKALSGLVDNAMRETPLRMPHFLFDAQDIPAEKKLLTTGVELANIEKQTRDKILHRDDEYDFLENDDCIEDDDDMVPPPIRKTSVSRAETRVGEGEEGEAQAGPSSVNSSLNPSTPNAETENSEAASELNTPNKGSKAKNDDNEDEGVMSQGEKEEDFMAVMSAAPRKKRLRKAAALSAIMCEDEIKMGPILSTDDLAAKFQQILFDKVSMGSNVQWRHGANAEELQTDSKTINEESVFVEKCSMDMDLMHLDKLWASKYYTKVITPEEVKEIKADMKRVLDTATYEKRVMYLKAGEYEFMGEDDKWDNTAVPPDEMAHLMTGEQPLVRPLEDQAELERHKKALEVEEDSEADHGSYDVDADDERIVIAPEGSDDVGSAINDFNDDGGDMMSNGFMSDTDLDDPATSSTRGGAPTDFTAGDDQRVGEMGDVNGMLDPMFANELAPSAAVRGAGKADDSHWKGGEIPDVAKKERKKKVVNVEEELKTRGYFECTEDMLDKMKTRNRFKQAQRNVELMKETDELLMPSAVRVLPQEDYDTSVYYHSFFLPQELHSKYVYRDRNDIVDPNDTSGHEVIHLDHGRLDHYTNMLDSSFREDNDEGEGGDVYFGFLRMFKNYPEVLTHREAEMEERVRTGEMQADEAAVVLNNQDDGDMMENGGDMDFNDDDFGGGMGSGGEEDEGKPVLPSADEATFVNKARSREASEARSTLATHGYGMRVENSEDGDDEGDAIATVGDREYHLRLIKLDTVAMKTALSDVLTNPLMEANKLDETLNHFHRNIPTQRTEAERKKKDKAPMQTINEDEELGETEERPALDESLEDEYSREIDIEATMMEVPDAMNVTRALFAPPKEKSKPNKTIMFGEGASTSQNHSHSSEHIELKGHHTLKSTFTCLPARMPVLASSDVTVASTIAMILHLANENNLILEQDGQNVDGIDEDGNTTTTMGDWMNDFEVHCLDDDAEGTKMANISQRISDAAEMLQQLSADEDPMDAEKRQRETEKMLAEVAARQRAAAEEEKRRKSNGVAKKKDMPGSSKAPAFSLESSDDEAVDVTTVDKFKKPIAPHKVKVESTVRKATPRKSGDYDSEDAPSSKRSRTRISNGANTTVNLEDTILLD